MVERTDQGSEQLSQIDYWMARAAASYAAFWEYPVRAMGGSWARWDDVWAADPQCLNPVPNGATLLRPLDVSRVEELVARLSWFYAQRPGAPWVLWNAWPSPDLTPWGFELLEHDTLMVRQPGDALPTAPAELRIVEVIDAATPADFDRAFIEGFPLPELQSARSGSLYDERVLGGPLRLWVGYLGNRPVTTAGAMADHAINGIYAVSTVAEARGRGFATAVTARAVTAYPSLPAVLEATDLGRPIYRRLGFAEVAPYSLWLKPR
jgi:hypothetical protein